MGVMVDGSQGTVESSGTESEAARGGSCPEGYCEKTLRLERELMRWKREESALRDLERRYLAILDSPLLVFMVLFKGRVLFMNRCGEEFFGFSLRERPRFKLSDYVAPGFETSVDQVFSPDEGEVPSIRRLTYSVRSEDGRERTVDCAFVPGTYQGMSVYFTTGYELLPSPPEEPVDSFSELILREREDLLLCGMDGEGTISVMTEGFRRASLSLWGAAASEGERLPGLRQSMSPSDPFRLAFDRACAGEPATTSVEAGEALYQCDFAPVYTKSGEYTGVSLILTDRAEQCRLERELFVESESFDRLFSVSSDMILLTAVSDGRIVSCSPALLSWSGYSLEELLDRPKKDLFLAPAPEEEPSEGTDVGVKLASGEEARVLVTAMTPVTTGGCECLMYVLNEVKDEPLAFAESYDEEYELPAIAAAELEEVVDEDYDEEYELPAIVTFELEEPFAESSGNECELPAIAEVEPEEAIDEGYDEEFEPQADVSPPTQVHLLDDRLSSYFSGREDALLCALGADYTPVFMTKGFEYVCTVLWGRPPLPNEPILSLMPQGVQKELFSVALDRAERGEATQVGQESGDLYFVLSIAPIQGEEGNISGFSIVVMDRTSHRALERERRAEGEKFRRLFQRSEEMLLLSLENGRVLQCNPAYLDRLGYGEPTVGGGTEADLGFILGEEKRDSLLQELNERGSVSSTETELRTSGGRSLNVSFSVERIEYDGRACLLFMFRPVEEKAPASPSPEESDREVESVSEVPDKVAFERHLSSEIALTKRYKRNISLILIELDGLGAIAERFGQEAKRAVLLEFRSAVKGRIRITDYLGSWRRDELAVLTQMSGRLALQEAEAIRELAVKSKLHPDRDLTASIGVAEFRRRLEMDEFVKRAEAALADAKKAGGNRAVLAPFLP